ncbi:hypothetical protein F7725_027883 [Dissostichus mawsoni]|uniref:Uncharacterized protein n=1 Tax=Dissostichus mawsoni TaxID=36200 RepID=A0A7J5XE48_DISMA|nr:hypothetical protein F7725_027883 [Dissostichus mawsoni]
MYAVSSTLSLSLDTSPGMRESQNIFSGRLLTKQVPARCFVGLISNQRRRDSVSYLPDQQQHTCIGAPEAEHGVEVDQQVVPEASDCATKSTLTDRKKARSLLNAIFAWPFLWAACTADETKEAVSANRTSKALTHRDSNSGMQTERERDREREGERQRAPDRQAVQIQCERREQQQQQQQQQYLNRAPQPLSCEVRPQSLLIGHWSGLRLTSFGLRRLDAKSKKG